MKTRNVSQAPGLSRPVLEDYQSASCRKPCLQAPNEGLLRGASPGSPFRRTRSTSERCGWLLSVPRSRPARKCEGLSSPRLSSGPAPTRGGVRTTCKQSREAQPEAQRFTGRGHAASLLGGHHPRLYIFAGTRGHSASALAMLACIARVVLYFYCLKLKHLCSEQVLLARSNGVLSNEQVGLVLSQSGLAGTSAGMFERFLPVYSSVPFASCYIHSLLKP